MSWIIEDLTVNLLHSFYSVDDFANWAKIELDIEELKCVDF